MKCIFPFILLMFSCHTEPRVIFDYDSEANFNNYKTYDFSPQAREVKHSHPQYDNSLNRKRIMKSVDLQLIGRGYVKDTLNPDLLVNIHLMIKSKKEVRSYPTTMRYRYWQDYNVNIYDYDEGSLIIDLIDAGQNQLVWQGVITGGLDIKPEEIEPAINSAVALIFGKYAYRAHD